MSDVNSQNCMPKLVIGDLEINKPIIQGGMGLGVSLAGLASAVANEGGVGVISAVGIGMFDSEFKSNPLQANLKCLREEIIKARGMTDGVLGFNILIAISNHTDYIRVAQEAGIDMVFTGAGLPLDVPGCLNPDVKRPKLVPIVSGGRAAAMICRRWKKRHGFVPDAFVVEGPLAGGHLGFSKEEISDPKCSLDNILVDVLESIKDIESNYGQSIPVIAAGGIYTGKDIKRVLELGASGVQMGTRFVATEECDVSDIFKKLYVECKEEDIRIIDSPIGLPGRVINNAFVEMFSGKPDIKVKCPYACITSCKRDKALYCIAEALLHAKVGDMKEGFAFAGANAYRIKEIITVHELFEQLCNDYCASN